jgi:hypothetical protein
MTIPLGPKVSTLIGPYHATIMMEGASVAVERGQLVVRIKDSAMLEPCREVLLVGQRDAAGFGVEKRVLLVFMLVGGRTVRAGAGAVEVKLNLDVTNS